MEDLRLPIRASQDEDESDTFLGNKISWNAPIKRKSPKVKSMFRTISWKSSPSNSNDDVNKNDTFKKTPIRDGNSQSDLIQQNPALSEDVMSKASGEAAHTDPDSLDSLVPDSSMVRKRSFDENARSFIAKKSKPCTSADLSWAHAGKPWSIRHNNVSNVRIAKRIRHFQLPLDKKRMCETIVRTSQRTNGIFDKWNQRESL